MEDLLKGLAGLKTEISADVQKHIDAVKAESAGTAADIEKKLQAQVDATLEKLGKSSEELKQAIEKSETEMAKKLASFDNGMSKDVSISALVTKALSEGLKDANLEKGQFGERVIDIVKTPTTMTTANSILGPGGSAPTAAEIFAINNNQLIEPIARRQTHIRNIFGMGTSDDSVFNYLIENAKEGTIGVQNPEGSAKNQIENQFQLAVTQASTIAAIQIAGRQTLRNVRGLATLVQALMLNDLLIKEDDELLNGTNTNGRVQGVIPGATAPTSFDLSISAPNNFDVVAAVAAQLAKSDIIADFALLNPVDYWGMVTTKDKDDDYLQKVIFDAQARMLYVFGIPVFPTTAIAAGSFLAGASRYVMPMQYEGISLILDETGETNRKNNTVTIRVEEQVLQAVTKPSAFYAGTLAAAKAAIAPST